MQTEKFCMYKIFWKTYLLKYDINYLKGVYFTGNLSFQLEKVKS